MRKYIIISIVTILLFLLLVALSFKTSQRARVERQIFLYKKGLEPNNDKDNPFAPKSQLAFYDSMELLKSNTDHQTATIQFFKAVTLLKLGQETKAVEVLKDLNGKLNETPNSRLAIDSRKYLGLAYLRLGERSNCISNHSMQSCIFPIQGSGVYMDRTASQKAIDTYQEILTLDTGDLESRWLLNLAYMTIGQYPAKVPSRWLIDGLDKDTSSCKVKPFVDMAGDLKLNNSRNMAGGVIIDDFNNDGYLDIITSAWGLEESMHYFKNNGDGTFSDISKQSGLADIKGGLNIIQADYNNDGYTDILVLRGAWLQEFGKQPMTLLKNNGNGTFTDVTVESGILSFNSTQTATWADFNNDGWLDLFVGNETVSLQYPRNSQLFINNHDGTFTNVAKAAGCELTGFMKGVVSADYNNDGWPDIFISDLNGKSRLLKNTGNKSKIPKFVDATQEAGLDQEMTNTFPTWFWDYDNDGWPDIFACGYQFQGSLATKAAKEALGRPLEDAGKMCLYRNNHDGTFTNVSKFVNLNKPVYAMGSNFGDIDNDGWLDMYLGTGNPDFKSLIPNRMFKNVDGKTFSDVTNSARVGNLQKGHGVVFADVNNDGNQDIFIEVGGALPGDAYYNSLFINPGQNNNNWIGVLLEGVKSNRSAIGAHVVVNFTENGLKRSVYMDINSGGSFGANPLRKEIGIGKARSIDELIIKWPTSGIVQVFNNVAPRQFLRIKEGDNQIERMDIKPLQFEAQENQMKMGMKMISCIPTR
jgi:tetratricopeptide (TPR) repeat protein